MTIIHFSKCRFVGPVLTPDYSSATVCFVTDAPVSLGCDFMDSDLCMSPYVAVDTSL